MAPRRLRLLLVVLTGLGLVLGSTTAPAAAADTGSLTVKLTVSSRSTGELMLYQQVGTSWVPRSLSVTSRGTHQYSFTNIPAARYKLRIGRTTWYGGASVGTATVVTVKKGATTKVTAAVGPTTDLHTRVEGSDNGELLRHVLLLMYRTDRRDEVIAAGWGRLEAPEVPTGRYEYVVRMIDPTGVYADRVAFLERELTMQRAMPDPAPQPAPVGPRGTLRGDVVPAASVRSTDGVQAEIHQLGGPDRPVAIVPLREQYGQYSFGAKDLPVGEYRVHLTDPSLQYAPTWVGGTGPDDATTFAVEESQTVSTGTTPIGTAAGDPSPRFDPPADFRVQQRGSNVLRVQWDESDGADGYVAIDVSTDPSMKRVTTQRGRYEEEVGSWVTGLKPGTTYYLRVAVTDAYARRVSNTSPVLKGTTFRTNEFRAPTGLEVVAESYRQVDLRFDPVPGAPDYDLQYNVGKGWKTAPQALADPVAGTVTLAGMKPNLRHQFRIAVADGMGSSAVLSPYSGKPYAVGTAKR